MRRQRFYEKIATGTGTKPNYLAAPATETQPFKLQTENRVRTAKLEELLSVDQVKRKTKLLSREGKTLGKRRKLTKPLPVTLHTTNTRPKP